MRILEPVTLNVLATNRCTASCRHCCMASGPDRQGTLTYAQMEHILLQAFEELRVSVVVFGGGEPLLLGEDLMLALRLCRRHGVRTRVVTNAYWASSAEAARQTVRQLRDAGLDELNVSTDDYHLPWISLQRVRTAFEAALMEDFSAIALATCAGPGSALSAEGLMAELGVEGMTLRFDAAGQPQALVPSGAAGRLVVLSNARTQRIGRGLTELGEDELDPADDAALLAEVGGCTWAVKSAAISPRGHLLSCCGFELDGNPILDYGDLLERPLKELLDAADGDLITNAIAVLGPPRIKQLLEEVCPGEIDFPQPSYRTYCEVCADLVGREKNRQALYRHQGVFADLVLRAREAVT